MVAIGIFSGIYSNTESLAAHMTPKPLYGRGEIKTSSEVPNSEIVQKHHNGMESWSFILC